LPHQRKCTLYPSHFVHLLRGQARPLLQHLASSPCTALCSALEFDRRMRRDLQPGPFLCGPSACRPATHTAAHCSLVHVARGLAPEPHAPLLSPFRRVSRARRCQGGRGGGHCGPQGAHQEHRHRYATQRARRSHMHGLRRGALHSILPRQLCWGPATAHQCTGVSGSAVRLGPHLPQPPPWFDPTQGWRCSRSC
jgi:hypothetical protein